MRVPKLDLRTPEQKDEPRRRVGRFAVFFIVLLITIGSIAFSTNVIFSNNPVMELGANTFLGQLRALVRAGDRKLAGEASDRINILIMGIGGVGHDGPDLTDTVILASLKPSTGKVALVSIPRDLLIDTPDYGQIKLNAVDAYADAQVKNSGPAAEAAALSAVLGQPIDYWARLDFNGFKKMIDAIGGVDVTVDRSFTDNQFPISDTSDGVKTVSFTAGPQHMDGQRALDFTRSRHGDNGEGSDFARSKRQEKVILAVREKLLAAGTLLNPFTMDSLYETVKGSLLTNLQTWEAIRLAQTISGLKTSDISLSVMSDQNVLVDARDNDGEFVLLPKDGDWSAVAAFAENVFNDASVPGAVPTAEAASAPVRLEIQNGTTIPGLAQRTADSLMAAGFAISKVGNASERAYDQSVIYDLTDGEHNDAIAKIKSVVDANVAPALPVSITPPTDADFLIILGKNAAL
jgi:LCP family protein required for cell wall assembly